MRVVVITPPQPVVDWGEAKAHLRLDDDTDQDLVEGMIDAATGHIDGPDGWLGRAIGVQTLELRTQLPLGTCAIRLPYPPTIQLESVKYLDMAGVEQTADLLHFELLGSDLVSEGNSWIWDGGSLKREALRVRYTAGYALLPAAIRAAILLMVGDLYENRDSTLDARSAAAAPVPMPTTVQNLLSPYRVFY